MISGKISDTFDQSFTKRSSLLLYFIVEVVGEFFINAVIMDMIIIVLLYVNIFTHQFF